LLLLLDAGRLDAPVDASDSPVDLFPARPEGSQIRADQARERMIAHYAIAGARRGLGGANRCLQRQQN
jgi:hypothetical protein